MSAPFAANEVYVQVEMIVKDSRIRRRRGDQSGSGMARLREGDADRPIRKKRQSFWTQATPCVHLDVRNPPYLGFREWFRCVSDRCAQVHAGAGIAAAPGLPVA